LSNRIKEIRLEKKMTQKSLAAASGISQPYLLDLEANRRGAKPETWARIAKALGVPVRALMGKEEHAETA